MYVSNEPEADIQKNGGSLMRVAIHYLLFQQFTHRIDLTQIGKGKILVVQYHPFGTLFQRKVLNLRKETKRHNDLTTVRQESSHFSTERRGYYHQQG